LTFFEISWGFEQLCLGFELLNKKKSWQMMVMMAFLIDAIAYNRTIIVSPPFIIPFFSHYMPLIFPNTLKAFPVLLLRI